MSCGCLCLDIIPVCIPVAATMQNCPSIKGIVLFKPYQSNSSVNI